MTNNTSITLLIECADKNGSIPNRVFEIGDCTIDALYQENNTIISLHACGFTGEFSDGNIIAAQPSVQFNEFCRVHFNAINGILIKSFTLDEMQTKLDELAQEYPDNIDEIDALGARISKMATTLYNLAGNAKLLNKHPKDILPF